jgi:hypothetical protein
LILFAGMQKLRRFARYWDLLGNSGNFVESTPLLWSKIGSPFAGFMKWSEWLHARTGRTDSIALVRLMELLFEYLVQGLNLPPESTAAALWRDYQRGGRRDKPGFLKEYLPRESAMQPAETEKSLPKRQARHLVRGNPHHAA